MAASSGWMWIDHARAITSTTHIDNLVDAIELALTKGQPGEAYLNLGRRRAFHEGDAIGLGGQRGCRPAGPLHPLLARRPDWGGGGGGEAPERPLPRPPGQR